MACWPTEHADSQHVPVTSFHTLRQRQNLLHIWEPQAADSQSQWVVLKIAWKGRWGPQICRHATTTGHTGTRTPRFNCKRCMQPGRKHEVAAWQPVMLTLWPRAVGVLTVAAGLV